MRPISSPVPSRPITTASLAVLASLAATSGETQARDVLWRVELPGVTAANRPAIGPDGEIAMQTTEIVVVEPDGTERWRRAIRVTSPSSICDFDDQGRLYANSFDGIRAFGPDGSDLWLVPTTASSHRHGAGPTVGPDGNVYFLDWSIDGLGFGSISPDGRLRWNIDGFRNDDSDRSFIEVAFSNGNALVSSPGLPDDCGGGCLGSGLMAFSFDGDEQWTLQTTTPFQPTVRPDGDIFLPIRPSALRLVDGGDGSASPVTFGSRTPVERAPTAVAPDGTGYTVVSFSRIWRVEQDGSTSELGEYGAIMGAPAISPDGSMIVLGTAETLLPSPNDITAIDTQTGEILWEVALPQENDRQLSATGWPRFSEDGSAVYVGVSAGDRSYLYALSTGLGGLRLAQGELRRGEVVTFTVSGAAPGEVAYVLYSLAGVGSGPCIPELGGLCLDLLEPVDLVGTGVADADGNATVRRRVPGAAPLGPVHTQAVVRRGTQGSESVKSDVVTDEIRP